MAVFTPVSLEQLQRWLERYSVGTVTDMQGIASGIENTNYFVTTTQGRFVLTLFEKLTAEELPFYLNLMAHLAQHGIPCPRPIADLDDRYLGELNARPASLVSRLDGSSDMAPTAARCAEMGTMVASMHLAAAHYPPTIANPRGPHWWALTAPKVMRFLDDEEKALLRTEMTFQASHRFDALPRGVIHADLFRDNVLFRGDAIGGVIDFYFAGDDAWLFDLAVVANDWCLRADHTFDPDRLTALLSAYTSVRSLRDDEMSAWPVMLRAGALRFWLSRLNDFFLPRPGEIIHPHDPNHFKRILQNHVRLAPPWPLA